MRAPLSIVIPTLNAGTELPGILASLMEGVESGLVREVVIADAGSDDETCVVADDAGATIITGPAGRGGQLARGAAAAQGDWLLFVHADSWLCPGWSAPVGLHMSINNGSAGVFRLAFRAHGFSPRFVAGWANARTRILGLPYGDQGLLISRETYDSIGGFQNIPLMEDVAIARALRGKITVLDHVIVTGAGRYLQTGWYRRGARNLLILLLYILGVAPEKLARIYSKPKG